MRLCAYIHNRSNKKNKEDVLKETKAKNMKDKIQSEIAKFGEEGFEKSWGVIIKRREEYMAKK